jgi:hypothetical protein
MDFDEWAHRVLVVQDSVDYMDNPVDAIRGMTELFSSAGRLVEKYSTEQINEGLWFLSGGRSDLPYELYNTEVDEALRVTCAGSVRRLFTDLFAPFCQKVLATEEESAEPLNSICYMWWDNFVGWGRPESPQGRVIDSVLLGVMRENLDSANVACVESGLHGLGHWQISYPDQVKSTIDLFLRKRRNISAPLKQYALHARSGHVQ